MNQEKIKDLLSGALFGKMLDVLEEKSYTQMTLVNYRWMQKLSDFFLHLTKG